MFVTARGVYVVRYPTLLEWTSRSQADQAIERGRVCRTKGGDRGGIERLVPIDYYSPAKSPLHFTTVIKTAVVMHSNPVCGLLHVASYSILLYTTYSKLTVCVAGDVYRVLYTAYVVIFIAVQCPGTYSIC